MTRMRLIVRLKSMILNPRMRNHYPAILSVYRCLFHCFVLPVRTALEEAFDRSFDRNVRTDGDDEDDGYDDDDIVDNNSCRCRMFVHFQ